MCRRSPAFDGSAAKQKEVGVTTLPIEFQSAPVVDLFEGARAGFELIEDFLSVITVCLMASPQRRSGARHSGNYIPRRANCIDACSASGRGYHGAMLNNDLQNAGVSLPR